MGNAQSAIRRPSVPARTQVCGAARSMAASPAWTAWSRGPAMGGAERQPEISVFVRPMDDELLAQGSPGKPRAEARFMALAVLTGALAGFIGSIFHWLIDHATVWPQALARVLVCVFSSRDLRKFPVPERIRRALKVHPSCR